MARKHITTGVYFTITAKGKKVENSWVRFWGLSEIEASILHILHNKGTKTKAEILRLLTNKFGISKSTVVWGLARLLRISYISKR